jgi:hypothetical protein
MTDRDDLQLSAIQLQYLEWLCTPRHLRSPESEAKWATANHIDETTPRRWKRTAHFRKEWDSRMKELQGTPERTQELLDSLYDQGRGSKEKCEHCGQRGGDVRAAELWGRWTGQLKVAEAPAPAPSLRDVSDEQLEQILRSTAEDELAARRKRVEASR